MNKILKVLLFLIVPIGILLAATQLIFINASWQDAVIGTVSGIIGMVPEGLVLLTSATFIVAIIKLSQYDTLVQELSATEVLARVDVLCVDKTGTVTEGALKLIDVVNLSEFEDKEIDEVLASISHNLPSKNPTQQAILDKYKEDSNLEIIEKVPFSSKRKWGGIVLKDKGAWILGAPEIVMGPKYMEIKNKVEEEASKGRRVLLLAKSSLNSLKGEKIKDVEKVALVLIEDIIREDAPATIEFFKNEGVQIKVISGDNPVTVSAVGKRAGIEGAENYIDARELPKDMEELKKEVEKYSIFGRVTPHQKKDLVIALQQNGHTVAMTGDGVNDAPSLKSADIGVAMGITGTDVAKGAADMILTDDNFTTIVGAVEEGRNIYTNIKKAITFLLSCNFGEIIALFVAILLNWAAPLLPIHILWVNLITDSFPALSLGVDPSDKGVMDDPPRSPKEKIFNKENTFILILNGIIIGAVTLIAFQVGLNYYNDSLIHAQTMAFVVLSVSQLFLSLSMRSLRKSVFKVGIFKNKYLLLSILLGIALQIIIISVPFLASVFKVYPLNIGDFEFVFLISLVPFAINEIVKLFIKD